MEKSILDDIIDQYQAQPVGHGYIDIIVVRSQYRGFIEALLHAGFRIGCITWWEWCAENNASLYGLGGPRSQYYNGWFSELPVEVDPIVVDRSDEILRLVESKALDLGGERVSFQHHDWLTPAIWLDVPDGWRNRCGG